MGKPCDRCGMEDQSPKPPGMYEAYNEFSDEQDHPSEPEPAMCAEVHVAFGLVSWLCHNCRKEYHRFAKDSPLNIEYGEASLRLEFWKARVGPETPADAINEGLELWRKVEDLELKINEMANEWLISDPDEVRMR